MELRQVGTLRALYRYPVKSMKEEALTTVEANWHGLAGDRRWAFVRPGMERSGFPWLTIREKAELWRYEARFADAEVESAKTLVKTPEGEEFDVADPELARRLGEGVRVTKVYSGVFDTFPLSFLTVQSVEKLAGITGQALTPLRFRPSLVIDAGDGEFPEDRWVGSTLRIGTLRCRVDSRDQRCMMVNIEADGVTGNGDVLKAIARERQACFGVYGSIVEPGRLTVGDAVFIEG
jgi:uncharacterized protein YcbX